jgi:hypothetical protein
LIGPLQQLDLNGRPVRAEPLLGLCDEWHLDFARDFCNCKWDRKISAFWF